ncbi:MAG: SEC-C domain-containing protein [Gammaproteobacteria bacterium]|nr:SEC-C domain-containing protein [Gammaproteobacteria bacterium]
MTQEIWDDSEGDENDDLFVLFEVSARFFLNSTGPSEFLDRIASIGPDLAPSITEKIDPATGPPGQLFRMLGVAIYKAMPDPDLGYRTRPLPVPGRNDPCICGSGEKYKRCCLRLAQSFDLSNYNMLRHVLDQVSQKDFRDLPGTHVNPVAVADTAAQWFEEGRATRAVALLEPWFTGNATLSGALEPIFDQLMECYRALGNPRKRESLVTKLSERGDKVMRSAALQRRSTMRADRGDYAGAWEAFTAAQRMDPENLSLVALELTLLLSQGNDGQARERARFWLMRLERLRDSDLMPLIEFLRRVRDDPRSALAAADPHHHPALDQLEAMLADAPQCEAHYIIQEFGPGEFVLELDAALRKLEKRWRAHFPDIKPSLTATQSGDDGMWEDPQDWLDILGRNPLCWQSFEVLDDLVLAVDALQAIGTETTLLEPLLARGVALLDANITAVLGGEETLSWLCLENRPALRLLAHRTFRALEDPERGAASDDFIQLAEKLIKLNPGDNHGIRESLSHAYLARGWPEKAIELTGRYPDDFCGPALNRILALVTVGRDADAQSELSANYEGHAVAIKMLLAKKPRQPKSDSAYGIAMGGTQEAWLYRRSSLALWEKGGAIDWLRKACKKLR